MKTIQIREILSFAAVAITLTIVGAFVPVHAQDADQQMQLVAQRIAQSNIHSPWRKFYSADPDAQISPAAIVVEDEQGHQVTACVVDDPGFGKCMADHARQLVRQPSNRATHVEIHNGVVRLES